MSASPRQPALEMIWPIKAKKYAWRRRAFLLIVAGTCDFVSNCMGGDLNPVAALIEAWRKIVLRFGKGKAKKAAVALVMALSLLPVIASASTPASPHRDFIIMFRDQPDPSAFANVSDLNDRRRLLYGLAVETARRSQGAVLAFIRGHQLTGDIDSLRCFYLVNACAFRGAEALLSGLRAFGEVEDVLPDDPIRGSVRIPSDSRTPLWHHSQMGVDRVWNDLNITGDGIVAGSIDTGVNLQHPALSSKFRRSSTGETSDYNWFDAVRSFQRPSDFAGRGTHTTGSLVGRDTSPGTLEPNDVGIAYGAQWISAKALDESGRGLTSHALAAMQWMEFPSDVRGRVDTSLAPDIVSNSWSVDPSLAPVCRRWFRVALSMWSAAGILPVFQVGDGKAVQAPASLPEALAVGATDGQDKQATFSPEGNPCGAPSSKPDVYAPGTSIYSSFSAAGYPTYKSLSGTGMATPQVAGIAALMLQAAGGRGSLTVPDLIARIRSSTSTSCTGDVACRMRIDAYKAVTDASSTGKISGRVVSGTTGILGATVSASSAGINDMTVTTGQLGNFELTHLRPDLAYVLIIRAPDYLTTTSSTITLNPGETKMGVDFNLDAASTVTITGRVRKAISQEPMGGARIRILGTGVSAWTTDDGAFSISLPDPSGPDSPTESRGYDRLVEAVGDVCNLPRDERVIIDEGAFIDFVLPSKRDAFGHSCVEQPFVWKGGSQALPLHSDDESLQIDLPFGFPLYDNSSLDDGSPLESRVFKTAHIVTDGYIRFDGVGAEYHNSAPPDGLAPQAALYAFWDDLYMDPLSQILISTSTDEFTVEWREMTFKTSQADRLTFSATLHRNGDFEVRFLKVSGALSGGTSVTIGMENRQGTDGFVYSFDEMGLQGSSVRPDMSLLFTRTAQSVDVQGEVREQNTNTLLRGSQISGLGGGLARSTITDREGVYFLRLAAGNYSLIASMWGYESKSDSVVLSCGSITALDCPGPAVIKNFSLQRLPRGSVEGKVVDPATGGGLANVPVTIPETPLPIITTDSLGRFTFTGVPVGNYTVTTVGTGRCRSNATSPVSITSGVVTVIELVMPSRLDAFGYRCADFARNGYIEIDGLPILTGDSGSARVGLPFVFPFYGEDATEATVSVDGFITFGDAVNQPYNSHIPSNEEPNLAMFPFWDDLVAKSVSSVFVSGLELGSSSVIIEWKNYALALDPSFDVTFEVILHENGNFEFLYKTPTGRSFGEGASIGSESIDGSSGFDYSYNESVLSDGHQIDFIHPSNGPGGGLSGVQGRVLERETLVPIANADVVVGNGSVTGTSTTNDSGNFNIMVPPGTGYSVIASKPGFRTNFASSVTVLQSEVTAVADILLDRLDIQTVTGRVHDQRGPLVGGIAFFEFQITCLTTYSDPLCYDATGRARSISVVADLKGDYQVNLSEGEYEFVISGSDRCQQGPSVAVTLDSTNTNPVVNLPVTLPREPYGFTCIEFERDFIHALAPVLPVLNPVPIPLPFDFEMFGTISKVAYVHTDTGKVVLDGLEGPTGPVIHVFDDFIRMDGSSRLLIGAGHPRELIIEWRNAAITDSTGVATGERTSFSAVLTFDQSGKEEIRMYYEPIPIQDATTPSPRSSGSEATIGVSDCAGDLRLEYASNAGIGVVESRRAIFFSQRFDPIGASGC